MYIYMLEDVSMLSCHCSNVTVQYGAHHGQRNMTESLHLAAIWQYSSMLKNPTDEITCSNTKASET